MQYPRIEKWAFDTSARPPIYCEQTFVCDSMGLVHYIEGMNRAMIEAPHVIDYIDTPNVRQALTDAEYWSLADAYLQPPVAVGA